MSFSRDTLLTLFGYGVSTLLALAINAIVARALGPSGQGVYALLVVFSSLVALLAGFGLGPAAAFYVGRGKDSIEEIAGNLGLLAVLIGAPVAAALIIFRSLYAPRMLSGVPLDLVALVAALTPLTLGRLYAEYLLIAVSDFVAYNAVSILDSAVRLLLLVCLLGIGMQIEATAYALCLSTAISAACAVYLVRRRLPVIRFGLRGPLVRRLAAYGIRSYSAGVLSYLNLRVDQFLVGFFLTVDQVGLYAAAVILSEIGAKVANATTKTLFARVSSLDAGAATLLTGRAMRVTMTLALIVAAVTAATGSLPVRAAFGAAFVPATSALQWLLPGTLMLNLTQVLQSDLAGRGKPEIGTYASAVSVVVTLIGNMWLTPQLGITGAAASATAAYTAGAVVVVAAYLRVSGQSLRSILWMTSEDWRLISQMVGRALYHPGRA